MTTTARTYDTDLAAARALLADRLSAAIGEDDFLAAELPKSLDDALSNSWVRHLTIAGWAATAAAQIGI